MALGKDALQDVPVLTQHLAELVRIGSKVFAGRLQFDSEDDAAFMAVNFAVKQIEHAKSVLVLGDSVDAILITRSMFEGLSQLLWAMKERNDRPARWRSYAVVRDWRTLQQQLGKGIVVPPDRRTEVEHRVENEGTVFLTPKARAAIQAGQPPPKDPYMRNWYTEKEKEVFADVGAAQVYDEIYGPFSEWHHWRVGGFGPLLKFDPSKNSFTITTQSPELTASALSGAFQCLYQTLDILEGVVPTGIRKELDASFASYIA